MKHRIKMFIRKFFHKVSWLEKIYIAIGMKRTKRLQKLSDEEFMKKKYNENTGHVLNLYNPQRFNEKLLWLQLNDHNPLYTKLSDKYLVKDYVSKKIGARYVVPLLGVWEDPKEIPFDELPDEFVLKCNHDCGSAFIKRKDDVLTRKKIKKIINRFEKALKLNYYYEGRVWGYKNIQPKVICEALIHTDDGKLPKDYKIFCFNGEPCFTFVASDRGENTKFDFYTIDWEWIPVKQHYPNSKKAIPKPKQWDEMLNCARILSRGIPQVRVDFYINNLGQVIFGEMTFCHFAGCEAFEPDKYDFIFGKFFDLHNFQEGCCE